MNSRIENNIKIILELTEEEALWLKGLVQNHLGSSDESSYEYDMRTKFWNAVKNVKEDGYRGVKKEGLVFLGEDPKFKPGVF